MSPSTRIIQAAATMLVGWLGTRAEAESGVLTIRPDNPPSLVAPDTAEFPSARGPIRLPVLPAVVVHTASSASPHPRARSLGGHSWKIPTSGVAAALALSSSLVAQADVDAVFPDVVLAPELHDEDPHRASQWYLDVLEMDTLHAVSLGDPTVRIAVIDSGIDHEHPDLVDRVAAPYDAYDDDFDPSPVPGEYCNTSTTDICDTHGTAVAGVVAATAENGIGISGLCPGCTLIPIRMLGESGGSLSISVAAFEHAITEDAAVINNSWGYNTDIPAPAPLAAVIERARTEPREGRGAVVVFAAGNDNRTLGDAEVCALPAVVCVSAIDNYGYPTSYTNSGAPVDLAAPSATVSISPVDDFTTQFGGTSAPSPVVAGIAGWILSVSPEYSADEVAELLITTASESPFVTHGEDGHHDTYGHGIVDPPAILAVLQSPDEADTGDTTEPADPAPSTSGRADKTPSGCSVSAQTSPGAWWLALVVPFIVRQRRPAPMWAVRYVVRKQPADFSTGESSSRCGQWHRMRAHSRGSGRNDLEVG